LTARGGGKGYSDAANKPIKALFERAQVGRRAQEIEISLSPWQIFMSPPFLVSCNSNLLIAEDASRWFSDAFECCPLASKAVRNFTQASRSTLKMRMLTNLSTP
jgi:hypothetical protein